jgi:hypothetical protein
MTPAAVLKNENFKYYGVNINMNEKECDQCKIKTN